MHHFCPIVVQLNAINSSPKILTLLKILSVQQSILPHCFTPNKSSLTNTTTLETSIRRITEHWQNWTNLYPTSKTKPIISELNIIKLIQKQTHKTYFQQLNEVNHIIDDIDNYCRNNTISKSLPREYLLKSNGKTPIISQPQKYYPINSRSLTI